uniref:Ubiquinol-cytochrome c reductase n=1 Tax=Aquisalinus luteolus TaxID=1566827 RepID=A0A8J3EQZ7_9PROT|nr:ubiquinol-cytochrome c reductase [Aquisalinus luteolus]
MPRGRLSRLGGIGSLGAGIAGNMLVDGAKRLSRGERPSLQDLLLTPQNASKAADQLSRLRGAAMKVGQLISLDNGDFLPPELADIMGRLRSSADAMPPHQLKRVLNDNWGTGWRSKFESFTVRPIAAASIGQVHWARTVDGRDMAIKVQYPGVRESIDSDVDNVATLIRMSGLLPKDIDIKPVLEEAKAQLREEADYLREAAYLNQYREALADREGFLLPRAYEDLTTRDVLAMSFVSGDPIEKIGDLSQERRDTIMLRLMRLLLDELLELRLMQTDPNFANYFYDRDSDRIVLLDFGATREISGELSDGYRQLLKAGLDADWDRARDIAIGMGLMGGDLGSAMEAMIREVFAMAVEPLSVDGPYDFGASDLASRLSDKAMTLRKSGFNHIPPPVTIFLHRKIGGMYLLATRLKARIDLRALAARYI